LSLVLLITTSATTSFLQNAVFAISAQFPEKYMQSFFSGQGVAGVLTSIVPLVIALSVPADVANTPESVKSRAGGYFIGCAAFSVLSLAMFAAMQRSSVFRFYHRLTREEAHADMTLNETMDENGSTILQEATGKSNTLEPLTWSGFVRVMKRIKLHAFSVAFCFLVTTAFFPAITASVRSVGSADASRFSDPVVFLLIHFLFFNVMDWVSRYIPMLHPRLNISKPSALFWFAIGRLVFVPLLLLSNVDGPVDGSARPIPSALANDAAYLVILSLFAITDGWLATCCLITAPTRMKGEEARVGMAMSFIYTIGLVLGSIVSFGIRGALCECNPFIA
jgi:equilibrative nucleoside transporter 1/2/3